MHVVRPIMLALVSANLVNAAGNWLLIYGNLGFPALGVAGSAWATTASRVYMAAFLMFAVQREHRRHPHVAVAWRFHLARIRQLITLGLPAAAQITLEVGVFAAATALAGKLDPVSSGSHQIALNLASLAFMVPLGLASSAAVRVGHALGARDPARAATAGWTALASSAVLMLLIGALFYLVPVPLLRAFTSDVRVIDIGVGLLAIAAAFQLFDGAQAVATGVLRGAGDTRTPMITNIVGHWILGLPVGYALCFVLGWGVAGLWIGLSIGLTFVSAILIIVWWKRAVELRHAA
jgi:multidrug resistance protein, MATE family